MTRATAGRGRCDVTTARALTERRLRYWRGRLSVIAETLDQELREPRCYSGMRARRQAGMRAFLYREKFVCTTVLAELDQLARELDRDA